MTRGERRLINKMNRREHSTLRSQEKTRRTQIKAGSRAEVSRARSRATMASSGAASAGGSAASIGSSLASGGIGENGDNITNIHNYYGSDPNNGSAKDGTGDGRNPGSDYEGN